MVGDCVSLVPGWRPRGPGPGFWSRDSYVITAAFSAGPIHRWKSLTDRAKMSRRSASNVIIGSN